MAKFLITVNAGWTKFSTQNLAKKHANSLKEGSLNIYGYEWTLTPTSEVEVAYDYDDQRGIKIGANSNEETVKHASLLTFTTSTEKAIKEVIVNTSGTNGVSATVSVKIGEVGFKCAGSTETSISSAATDYSFVGTASTGDVTITIEQTSANALYIKSVTLVFAE